MLFITTKGFIDLLDMQNEMRYDIYDLHADEVKHLVPKFMRFEVDERVDSSGKIHKKINKDLKKRVKLIPAGRMANKLEIAKFIFQLASQQNTFITGETLSIAGGE